MVVQHCPQGCRGRRDCGGGRGHLRYSVGSREAKRDDVALVAVAVIIVAVQLKAVAVDR